MLPKTIVEVHFEKVDRVNGPSLSLHSMSLDGRWLTLSRGSTRMTVPNADLFIAAFSRK